MGMHGQRGHRLLLLGLRRRQRVGRDERDDVYDETGKVFVHLYVADEAGNEAYGSILVEVVAPDDGEPVPIVLYLAGAGVVMAGVVLATIGYMLLRRRRG